MGHHLVPGYFQSTAQSVASKTLFPAKPKKRKEKDSFLVDGLSTSQNEVPMMVENVDHRNGKMNTSPTSSTAAGADPSLLFCLYNSRLTKCVSSLATLKVFMKIQLSWWTIPSHIIKAYKSQMEPNTPSTGCSSCLAVTL